MATMMIASLEADVLGLLKSPEFHLTWPRAIRGRFRFGAPKLLNDCCG